MPLYEYECSDCRKRFEVLQKFSDDPVTLCIHCGGSVSRLISAPTFQFKGTGWYVTDYAKKDGSKAEGGSDTQKGGKGTEGGEKPSAASSETKESKKPSSTPTEKSLSE